jgi:DNA-binding IclR family transcriptional regulator
MLLGTLERRGYLVRASGDGYTLPSAPAEPGGWVGGIAGQVFRAAQPVMERLRGQIRETVVLGMPTPGLDIRIVSHRVSPQAIRYDISDVLVIPAYCTAMGHVILANLPDEQVRAYLSGTDLQPLTRETLTDPQAIQARLRQCKARGYALNIDERFEGAGGAAVAILDRAGRPHAALNIVTVTPRFRARQAEIVAALRHAAQELEAMVFGGSVGDTPTSNVVGA